MSIEREKRRKLIVDYIQKRPSATQTEITDYIIKKTNSGSQATIARDIKELGYGKANGKYIKTKTKLDSEQDSMLRNFIAYDESRILDSSKPLFKVVISTKKGMEQPIANLIHKKYETNIVGTLIGIGCVIVITSSKKNATIIEKKLKSYKNEL